MLATFTVPANAQSLRDLVSGLFVFGNCGEPLCLDFLFDPTDETLAAHGSHFLPAIEAGNASILAFVDNAVSNATSNVPLGATSGGFMSSTVDAGWLYNMIGNEVASAIRW